MDPVPVMIVDVEVVGSLEPKVVRERVRRQTFIWYRIIDFLTEGKIGHR